MSANSNINLTTLDFADLKQTMQEFLKTQDQFKDYDFEGSNFNVLLDILAYNTYNNAFYLNMIGNEMFLDTCSIRESAVSHAKELNYVPRSRKSSQAIVNIVVTSANTSKVSASIPRGTTFSTRVGAATYTFSTNETFVVSTYSTNSSNNALRDFTFSEVVLYEGPLITESFVYTGNTIVISNPNIDTSSLTISVTEDGENTQYTKATTLFDIDSSSRIFFVQSTLGDRYQVVFGNNLLGRRPKVGSTIQTTYRIAEGAETNGAEVFTVNAPIQGESRVLVTTVTKASGGEIAESIDSIKFNAPRHFVTQERAVTTDDYVTLLTSEYPEINTAIAYGGEELIPAQYGRVFVAVDLKNLDRLPENNKRKYESFLRTRCPHTIRPVVVDPEYLYIGVNTEVDYNINSTTLDVQDIRSIVLSAITLYSNERLNNFNRTLRYSRLVQIIDSAHQSIVSNQTDISAIKRISPQVGLSQSIALDFGFGISSLRSSPFIYEGQQVLIVDNGNGRLDLSAVADNTTSLIQSIGKINYATGQVNISTIRVDAYIRGSFISVSAVPTDLNVLSNKNTLLAIDPLDVVIAVNRVRE